ncbi:MAG: hypothetical protein U1F61_09105 [Opitutaceae bacterium]
MESLNLNPRPPDDDEVDAWLRTRLAESSLPDAGFTAQFVTRLPPRPAPTGPLLRLSLCLFAAVAGVAVVVGNMPAWESVSSEASTWGDQLLAAVRAPSVHGVLVGVLVSLASVLFALKSDPTQETD